MSDVIKYGELDPKCLFDEPYLFRRAMTEFLGMDKTEEKARVVDSVSFGLWCHWWQRILCGSREVEALPGLLRFICEGIEDLAVDPITEGGNLGDLCRLWRSTWEGMVDRKSSTPRPGARSAKRGMKFCLIVLVLRYGLASGRVMNIRKRTLPEDREVERAIDTGLSLQEASEAASLLLALSALARTGEVKSVSGISFAAADKEAMTMGSADWQPSPGTDRTNLADFKKKGVGLAGFKKLLRVGTRTEWQKVVGLATAYHEQSGRDFDKWMKGERLEIWFPASRPLV